MLSDLGHELGIDVDDRDLLVFAALNEDAAGRVDKAAVAAERDSVLLTARIYCEDPCLMLDGSSL